MTPLTVDLPPEMRARLSAEAERRRVSESAFLQAILEKVLAQAEKALAQAESLAELTQSVAEPREPSAGAPRTTGRMSCLDLAGDLIGCVRSGTPDLATNPRYLEEAIVRDARRWQDDI